MRGQEAQRVLQHPQIHPRGQTKLLRDGQELIGEINSPFVSGIRSRTS
jgi:hypothetical protein